MDKNQLKEKVCQTIDEAETALADYTQSVLKEPELGYKEFKTAKKTADLFRTLGLEVEEGLAITGVKATLYGSGDGPTIAILGELDAVGCPEHPCADAKTGAAHACGHFLQLGAMMGAAIGLTNLYKEHKLPGNVVFFAVPAEEYVEIAYRMQLREEGKINFLSGKQELIYLNAFKDVDMAMMIHSNAFSPETSVFIGDSSNGFLGKTIQYLGKEAHAAAAPEEGINALNAAMIGLMGINALRETFKDEDVIRVHPIITKGGDLVNSIPADVRMETFVRAKTMEAIEKTNQKVDRALKAGGDAIGAQTIIKTTPGYLPLSCSKELNELFVQNAKFAKPDVMVSAGGHFSASTDMGDLSHIMPTIHPFVGGVDGALHGRDFVVVDFSAACLLPAKAMALNVIDLLIEEASLAKRVVREFEPLLTHEEYIEKLNKHFN